MALPEFTNLDQAAVDEVVLDQELERAKAELYYAIDPYDLVTFCFPLDSSSTAIPDPDRLADDQISLNAVFYGRSLRPILLPSYQEDLTNQIDFMTKYSGQVADQQQILADIIERIGLDQLVDSRTESLLADIEDYFNRLFAADIALRAIGAARLIDIAQSRLNSLDALTVDVPITARLIRSYRPTSLVHHIKAALVDYVFEQKFGDSDQIVTEYFRRRTEAAAIDDARAVDLLLYLNRELAKAFDNKKSLVST